MKYPRYLVIVWSAYEALKMSSDWRPWSNLFSIKASPPRVTFALKALSASLQVPASLRNQMFQAVMRYRVAVSLNLAANSRLPQSRFLKSHVQVLLLPTIAILAV